MTASLNNTAFYSGTALTTTGTVSIGCDSSSLPIKSLQSLSGGTTITYVSDATAVAYTPTTSANWPSVPTTVQTALDNLASTTNALISQAFIASATQPYLSYATGDSNTVSCAFMYPGTTYYGASPSKWTVITSNTVNANLGYTLTLKDITNNHTIATMTASSVAVNATPAMISTTSFSNVNASAAIYEIQVTVTGTSSSFNMYSSTLEIY
jgi:hypothetical protein